MELDDLKSAWQSIDRRLEQQHSLELTLYRDHKLDRARSGLRPLLVGQVASILCGILLIGVSVAFWTSHREVRHLMLAGLTMHAYGVLMIIVGGRTVYLIRQIDYSAPVVRIQRQLGQLRRFYVRGGMTIGLAWWLLWIPFMMMTFGFLGADLTATAPSVVYVGTGVGVAGLCLTLWLHSWSRRANHTRLAQFVTDSVTGSSLLKAQRVLDQIAQFEQE